MTEAQEAFPRITFLDVGAVVYYLKAIPWLVDDFSAEKYRDRLHQMHAHIQRRGKFTATDHRFLVVAERPLA